MTLFQIEIMIVEETVSVVPILILMVSLNITWYLANSFCLGLSLLLHINSYLQIVVNTLIEQSTQ